MFEHIDPQHDKVVYPYKKNDGFIRPCFKGCPNCEHCEDVLWDYTNGIYYVSCELHEIHDAICADYENDGTKPITIDEFNELKRKEDVEIWNGVHGQTIMPKGIFGKIFNDLLKEGEEDGNAEQ